MYKFKVGDKLFLHQDNSVVTVLKAHPHVKKMEPMYMVEHSVSGEIYNEKETNLYINKSVYPGAVFRIDEIVYGISDNPVRYTIVSILYDTALNNEILYKCMDEDGDIKYLPDYMLSLYDYATVSR